MTSDVSRGSALISQFLQLVGWRIQSMIRKSGCRFSEKIMLEQKRSVIVITLPEMRSKRKSPACEDGEIKSSMSGE
jgi:hypothetical protein